MKKSVSKKLSYSQERAEEKNVLPPIIAQGITERKLAEESLRDSEIHYRRLFEAAKDGILILDADTGAITDANPYIREILGYSPDDLIGKRLWEIGAFFDVVASKAAFEELQRKEYIRYDNLPLKTKDGQFREVEFISNVYLVDLKKVIQCNIRNITKRREAEKALEESEVRYRRLFESAKDGILILDAESGKVLDANPFLLDTLNFSKDEVIGKELWEIGPFKYIIANKDTFQKLQNQEYVRYENLLLQNKEGINVHMEFVSSFFFVNDRKVIQCNIRDITERCRVEENLRETNEYLENLFNYANAPIIVWYPSLVVHRFNHAFERLSGYHAAEVRGKSISVLFSKEKIESSLDLIQRASSGENWETLEVEIQKKDGESRILLWNSANILDKDGTTVIATIAQGQDITERKQAEEEISNLARFPSENPNPVLRVAVDGKILYANLASEALLRMWNCGVDEYLPADWRERIANTVKHNTSISVDVECEEQFYSLFLTTIRDTGYVNLYGRDITEHNQAVEKLRASEVRYRRLFESAQDGILILDAESGKIVDINPFLQEMLGYTHLEVIGKTLWEIAPFKDIPANKANFRELQSNQYIRYEDLPLETKDGQHKQVEFVSNVYLVDGKKVIQCNIRDITKRRQAEKKLKESEDRFRTAFEYAPVGMSLTGIDGSFLRVNSTLCKLLGYSKEELLKKNFFDLTPPEDIELSKEMVTKSLEGEGFISGFEKRYIRKDGKIIWVEISSSLLRDNKKQPQYFIVQTIDITERKHSNDTIRQMQKLEGLGTLAGGIAHDFNNILGIILAYITSTKRFKDDPTELDLVVDTIVKAVERGKTLVQQILMFARKTETSFGAVNANDVVMEIVNMIYEMFPRNVTCSQNFDKSIPWINADRSQLHQVLMNLCVNARDAMPKGGVLGINTRMVSAASLCAQHPEANESSYVCIEVSDTGEGMSDETRKRIFEPFFTTKDIGKGTGLGLSVVFGVIHAHKGFIDVESEPGEGTTFRFYLPASQAAMPVSIKEAGTQEEIPGGTETLLIIEDEEMLLMSLQMVLVEKGYKVLSAPNGLEALKIYEERKNDIALVLTDLGLPKMNGMEVCRRIKTINPNERVILATGYLEPEMKSEFLKAGIQHFLYKPYNLKHVLKEVREALDEK